MFTGLMLNTWIAASIVAVIAGVTGFFAVPRGQSFAAGRSCSGRRSRRSLTHGASAPAGWSCASWS
jgi:hypothetical protein